MSRLGQDVADAFEMATETQRKRLVAVLVDSRDLEAPARALLLRLRATAETLGLVPRDPGLRVHWSRPPDFVLQTVYGYLRVDELLCLVGRLSRHHARALGQVGWPTIAWQQLDMHYSETRQFLAVLDHFVSRQTRAWRNRVQLVCIRPRYVRPRWKVDVTSANPVAWHLPNLLDVRAHVYLADAQLSDLSARLPSLRSLGIAADSSALSSAGLGSLARFQELECLSLHFPFPDEKDDWSLDFLALMPRLASLTLEGEGCDDWVRSMPRLSDLTTLQLHGTRISDAGLVLLDRLPALRRLSLVHGPVTKHCATEQGFWRIQKLPLEALVVSEYWSLRDQDLGFLGSPKLRELDLSACLNIGSEALRSIGDMASLERLDLSGCRFSGKHLGHLSKLRLTELNLSNMKSYITKKDLALLLPLAQTLRTVILVDTFGSCSASRLPGVVIKI